MKTFYVTFLWLLSLPTFAQVIDYQDSTQQKLFRDVQFLTQITPYRNAYNLSSLNKASDYIFQEFSKLNCQVEFQKFEIKGKVYRNVIASFNPRKGKRIVIGSHYDVCRDQQGADDNASGIAGLLQTARLLDQLGTEKIKQLPYQIDLVAYTLEEPPFFATPKMGSAVHAQFLKDQKISVELMVCYEMIGYFSDKPNSQDFPEPSLKAQYPNQANFIMVLGMHLQPNLAPEFQKLMKKHSSIDVQSIVLPFELGLESMSDQRNYWQKGYDAVMITDTSFFRNPNYHSLSDTIETLNFQKMAEVVKGVFGAIIEWE